MNAAARLVHQSGLSKQLFLSHFLNKRQVILTVMVLTVLSSALSIVYVTQITRVLHAAYQANAAEKIHLQVEHGQLLLERSTWIMQARIQNVAESQLAMIVPNRKSVTVINEKE